MMGHQSAQEELFYQFRFDDHIPSDHLLRQLDELLLLRLLLDKLSLRFESREPIFER